jgi:hypothetical protein
VLTDDEAKAIEQGRKQGLSGPVVGTWVDRLLADRRERIERQNYIKTRLRQAFEYLETLLTSAPEPRPTAARERQPRSGTQR